MADFDPDSYLASRATRGGAFDPDAFLTATKPEFGSDAYIKDIAKRHGVGADYVRGLVESSTSAAGVYGIPVLGALAEKYDPYISAVAQPVTGAGAPGASVGERAAKDRALSDEIKSDFQREHPHADAAARLIGGTAATLATGGTAAGARLLGMGGKNIVSQIARGAAANAAISGTDAAIRGDDVGRATAIGGLIGGVAPAAARAVGAAVSPVVARIRPPKPPPVPPARILDVTLSQGQAGRDLSNIQREQAALRGVSGPPAQQAAQEFANQQAAEVANTRDRLIRGLNPLNVRVAETPQQAGEVVQQGVQSAARAAKASVDAAYKAARELPGEIHPDVFRSMPQDIKTELSVGDEPVIIDDKTTPIAAQMIADIERRVGGLKIENRADPFGHPKPTTETRTILSGPGYHIAEDVAVPPNIVGISLKGVDQVRKRLSTMRGDAMGGANAADARAARAVLKAFDQRIDAAVDAGQFTGDSRAVNAWKAARAAHSDYRATFKDGGKNDPVGRVIERIVGADTAPERLPGNVADYLGGASSAGISGHLNAAVAGRIRSILGEQSEQWSAVKQGLLSRLLEKPQGVDNYGPRQVANRIGEFLNGNGRSVAEAVYSPAERQLITRYANLMRHLEVPQPGANWSNTATFQGRTFTPSLTGRVLSVIGERVGLVVHGLLGHTAGTAVEVATRHVAEKTAQAREAREIARMMPVIGNVTNSFARAATAAQRAPNPRNVARLMLAARNLSTNLGSIGITFSPNDLLAGLQGPQPAQGQQPKQQ